MSSSLPFAALLGSTLALLSACTSTATAPQTARTAVLERTTHGVAHITAPDIETLAYGVAYAHAQDNVCQTAQQLLTVRGERSKFLGGSARGLLGLRAAAQRADRPLHRRPHGRRSAGARLGPHQRRRPSHAEGLCDRL
ncbi:MAG: penicillin acylase family protein [Ideonella sp.]|nr:penicillin acylase family protein [Ideonella sp.]